MNLSMAIHFFISRLREAQVLMESHTKEFTRIFMSNNAKSKVSHELFFKRNLFQKRIIEWLMFISGSLIHRMSLVVVAW